MKVMISFSNSVEDKHWVVWWVSLYSLHHLTYIHYYYYDTVVRQQSSYTWLVGPRYSIFLPCMIMSDDDDRRICSKWQDRKKQRHTYLTPTTVLLYWDNTHSNLSLLACCLVSRNSRSYQEDGLTYFVNSTLPGLISVLFVVTRIELRVIALVHNFIRVVPLAHILSHYLSNIL